MKLLSKTCMYGIRASLFVASMQKEKKYVPIRQIANELNISFYFLTKILQMLTQHNIMVSYRGPKGGVALARPAREITLMDMINVIENDSGFDSCILGLPGCGESLPCPLHAPWAEARERIRAMFEDTNLEELGRKINQDGFRLTM